MDGYQYTTAEKGVLNNGVIDCRMNFTYKIEMFEDNATFPLFMRNYPEEDKLWIIPRAKPEIGKYMLKITSTEQP